MTYVQVTYLVAVGFFCFCVCLACGACLWLLHRHAPSGLNRQHGGSTAPQHASLSTSPATEPPPATSTGSSMDGLKPVEPDMQEALVVLSRNIGHTGSIYGPYNDSMTAGLLGDAVLDQQGVADCESSL